MSFFKYFFTKVKIPIYRAVDQVCTRPLPLLLGEVSRSDGESKWYHRHPLNFRDYESVTKSFVGNGLVPFRLQALS